VVFIGKKKTLEQIKEDISKLTNNEYSVIDNVYINYNTKILIQHNSDDCNYYSWRVLPTHFIKDNCRCPVCTKTIRRTHEYFEKEIFNLVGNEYEFLEPFKGVHTKILCRHNSDLCNNHKWKVEPNHFLRDSSRCPKCFGRIRKTQEEFEKEVFDLVGEEYTVLGEYKNASTKILMRHNCESCGNYEYEVAPQKFLNNRRCPACRDIKGEKVIFDYLRKNNITFKKEYRIAECNKLYPLPFDFAVFDNEDNLIFLIEYQGIQHYEFVKFFHRNTDGYMDRILYDIEKKIYTEYEHIDLLEIPYTDFDNIQQILEQTLIEYGLLPTTS
jgi:hypothetical protein